MEEIQTLIKNDVENNVSSETKLASSRIPKPFSIESLIAKKHRSAHSPKSDQNLAEDNNNPFNGNLQVGPFPSILPFTNLPLYNPWVSYLTHTASEKLSQFFTNSGEKFAHFLDANGHSDEMLMRDGNSKTPTGITSPGMINPKDKLAQYFVNNINKELNSNNSNAADNISDFINNYGDSAHFIGSYFNDKDKYFIPSPITSGLNVGGNVINSFIHNTSDGHSNEFNNRLCNNNNPDVEDAIMLDKNIDLESDESCSDLSLTLSPDGSSKNKGEIFNWGSIEVEDMKFGSFLVRLLINTHLEFISLKCI